MRGERLRFCSNAVALSDGTVWFTVSSRRYPLSQWIGDIVELVVAGDPRKGRTTYELPTHGEYGEGRENLTLCRVIALRTVFTSAGVVVRVHLGEVVGLLAQLPELRALGAAIEASERARGAGGPEPATWPGLDPSVSARGHS